MLKEEGVDFTPHLARQCSEDMLKKADLVLVMERQHLKWLTSRYPQIHGRSYLMGHWHNKAEVPDPIGQPRAVFAEVMELLRNYSDDWLKKVQASSRI